MLHPTRFAGLSRMVTTPDLVFHSPAAVQDAWLQLKEEQRREDGSSARIEGRHAAQLEAYPSHYPTPQRPNAVDAARVAALPSIRAAVDAHKNRRGMIARMMGRGDGGAA
ncbi:hypothetical protein [Salipiger abyssi]|uniref:hypothetical protein n=1 Tax=Salipiger abyssi TaxID=1250539 RepID=UPI001A8FA645|nr:hypothetical protein [Salipiger abyssi]MBN9890093.1 hypothetical protein [Salipiger abyssi]